MIDSEAGNHVPNTLGPVKVGFCGSYPRPEILPPKTGSPDDGHINRIWFAGLCIMYFVFAVIFPLIGYYYNILYFPLVFIDAFIVYRFYRKYVTQHIIDDQRTRLGDLIRTFFESFWSAGMYAILIELFISLIIVFFICLVLDKWNLSINTLDNIQMCGITWDNLILHFYNIIHAFFIAGMVEEYLKGFILQYCMKLYISHNLHLAENDVDTIIWLGLCTGLGFGTFEGIVYTCIYGLSSNPILQGFTYLVRVFIGIPFHCMTGILWGCQFAKMFALKHKYAKYNSNTYDHWVILTIRRWSKLGIRQTIFHGAFDFIQFELDTQQCKHINNFNGLMSGLSFCIALILTIWFGFIVNYYVKQIRKLAQKNKKNFSIFGPDVGLDSYVAMTDNE